MINVEIEIMEEMWRKDVDVANMAEMIDPSDGIDYYLFRFYTAVQKYIPTYGRMV